MPFSASAHALFHFTSDRFINSILFCFVVPTSTWQIRSHRNVLCSVQLICIKIFRKLITGTRVQEKERVIIIVLVIFSFYVLRFFFFFYTRCRLLLAISIDSFELNYFRLYAKTREYLITN